ncbi:MAG: hypothetical protein IJ716_16625 [Lachnospiraceae bacterium]|nr:hypothetical protein [Lachnospiraceae bacterium]
MKEFELQPLRIFAGWTVVYNQFSEYDPETDGDQYAYELVEDLLQLENRNLLIDLGWYPAMELSGEYVLYMIDKTYERPFDEPLEVFQSRSKKEILQKLEYWMNCGHYQQYLR